MSSTPDQRDSPVATRSCPECSSPLQQRGEWLCDECDVVIDTPTIDHGPEWRTFTEEEKQTRKRVGGPETITLHDRGLSTVINGYIDAKGNQVDRDKVDRLQRHQTWTMYGSGEKRSLRNVFTEVARLKSALELSKHVHEDACKIVREYRESAGDFFGRSFEGIACGCVFAACRRNRVPVALRELDQVSRIERKKIYSAYKLIKQELELEIPPPPRPSEFVPKMLSRLRRYVSKYDSFDEFRNCVEAVVNCLEDDDSHVGRDPEVVVAGAIYYVCVKRGLAYGEPFTKYEIADFYNMSCAPIKNIQTLV